MRDNHPATAPALRLCLARPDGPDTTHWLIDHLRNVGVHASAHDAGLKGEWLKLAGLLHDIGKARTSWQRYIRGEGEGVHHAFLGSALFFYLVQNSHPPRELRRYAMLLTRDIAHHHAAIGDLEDTPPWMGGWQSAALDEVDWSGVMEFLRHHAPGSGTFPTDGQALQMQLAQMPRIWRKWVSTRPFPDDLQTAATEALRLPTSRFIAADRFDAAAIDTDPGVGPHAVREGLERLQQFAAEKYRETVAIGGGQMAAFRTHAQEDVLAQLTRSRTWLTTLQMPTGTGKTLVAITHSLRTMANLSKTRLIYVAPYLSIVSQTAQIIRDATGWEVMEQHHLALPPTSQQNLNENAEGPLLTLESWQAPVVVTTFNQMFRALFPYSAQQSLRLVSLEQAVIIIDEPQIMDATAWNAFLLMLETACRTMDARALLMSATVPPHQYAMLSVPPTAIKSALLPAASSRYTLRVANDPMDSAAVIEAVAESTGQHAAIAVIVNTIGDVARLYRAWREGGNPDIPVLTVHGAMHALHKRHQIAVIKQATERHTPMIVIATQTLEAGIDLSFDHILRARPIFPSVVQAAGRANRHGQGAQSTVVVFDYVRPDGRDSRSMVYRDAVARDETDRILTPGRVLNEQDVDQALQDYYSQVFERNNYTGALERIKRAAYGTWSDLGGLEPFGASFPREPVFVPVAGPSTQPELWLDDDTRVLLDQLHTSIGQLYGKFLDPRTYTASFADRKRFLNLFGRFVTALPFKIMATLTEMDPKRRVQRLADPEDYSDELGLAAWFLRDTLEETVIW